MLDRSIPAAKGASTVIALVFIGTGRGYSLQVKLTEVLQENRKFKTSLSHNNLETNEMN